MVLTSVYCKKNTVTTFVKHQSKVRRDYRCRRFMIVRLMRHWMTLKRHQRTKVESRTSIENVILTAFNVPKRHFSDKTVIFQLKTVDSKRYDNVTSVDRRRHLSGINNNAFPCIKA